MGNKFEVWAYTYFPELEDFEYMKVYTGQSFIAMIRAAWEAKRNDAGCVKMYWRS